jgi:hypothetical protein
MIDGRIGHRPPGATENAVRLIEAGEIDLLAGQGNGMDGGPYFLGSEEIFPPRPEHMAPLLLAAKRTGTPFVFSLGGHGGADLHLRPYIEAIAEIGRENGVKFRVAQISGEISPRYLKDKIRAGATIRRSIETPRISEVLTEQDVDDSVRIQAQLGAEPIIAAFEAEDNLDGVLTGRAVDAGIFMAVPMLRGVDPAIAAHVGKLIETGSMIAEPTNALEGVVAEIDGDSFTVRPVSDSYRCTVRSVSAHTLFERENPFEEANPGGLLDVSAAEFEQVDERTVRVSGASWERRPYTVKIEGAQRIGYQTACVAAIRDPRTIANVDVLTEAARSAIHGIGGGGVDVRFHVYGRDGILGAAEPLREVADPHEVAIAMIVTAPTQEMATELAITGRLRLIGSDFPGRRSTSANCSLPFQRLDVPLGAAFVFNIWHLLPLEDPCEPFPYEMVELG